MGLGMAVGGKGWLLIPSKTLYLTHMWYKKVGAGFKPAPTRAFMRGEANFSAMTSLWVNLLKTITLSTGRRPVPLNEKFHNNVGL